MYYTLRLSDIFLLQTPRALGDEAELFEFRVAAERNDQLRDQIVNPRPGLVSDFVERDPHRFYRIVVARLELETGPRLHIFQQLFQEEQFGFALDLRMKVSMI